MKVQPKNQRVQKYIAGHLSRPGYRWDKVSDPRKKRGRRWKFRELMNALLLGLVSGCPTLRAVEGMSEDMGTFGRRYISRRAPDTTMWDLTSKLSSTELREQHIDQVKQSWRAKELKPIGLPCGVLSVDGKGLGALEDDAGGTAQKTHNGQGYEYFLARSLRAVLTSAEGRPCLDQMPSGVAVEVLSWLRLMAYNLLQLARRRSLRRKLPNGSLENPPDWRRLFEWVKQAWLLPIPPKADTACG